MWSDVLREGVLVAADSDASIFAALVLVKLAFEEAFEFVCGGVECDPAGYLLGLLNARRSKPLLDEVDGFRRGREFCGDFFSSPVLAVLL